MKLIMTFSLLLVFCTMYESRQVSAADLKVGDQAPAFKLPGSDGKTYELKDFKGKKAVIIAWFPKAFTGG